MSDPLLHHQFVPAPTGETTSPAPTRAAFFLHGILGSGSNLRGLAQAFVKADPRYLAVLVDLRLHGRSRALPPPHDVHACARDLDRLSQALELPVCAVVGHSFGGKVALAFHEAHPELERVVLLDSAPGARPTREGSEDTVAVIAMLEELPTHYASRAEFIEQVRARGNTRALGEWLAMNLERTPNGFALRVDVQGIRELLDSYFTLDLWSVIEDSSAAIDIVIGARSQVWDEAQRERAMALARNKPAVRVHVLENAGHWVHADDPAALREALFG